MLKVRGFLGIRSVDISESSVTIITGRNSIGKTSLLHAFRIGCHAMVNPLEMHGMYASHYLNHECHTCQIEMTASWYSTKWRPAQTEITEGATPQKSNGSRVCANTTNFAELKTNWERERAWEGCLAFRNRMPDLKKGLLSAGCEEDEAIDILHQCQSEGWDPAHEDAKGRARLHKRNWQDIVSKHEGRYMPYGSNKAQAYRPSGWREELKRKDLITLKAELAEIEAEIAGVEVKYGPDITSYKKAIDDITKEHKERELAGEDVSNCMAKIDLVLSQMQEGKKLRGQLTTYAGEIYKLVSAKNTMNKTHTENAAVMKHEHVRKLLEPGGIRAEWRIDAIKEFNEGLATLVKATGGAFLRVHTDLTVLINEHHAVMASTSERWKANALIKCQLALLHEAPYVILDDAEAVDQKWLKKFLQVFLDKIHAVSGTRLVMAKVASDIEEWETGDIRVFPLDSDGK